MRSWEGLCHVNWRRIGKLSAQMQRRYKLDDIRWGGNDDILRQGQFGEARPYCFCWWTEKFEYLRMCCIRDVPETTND